MNHPTTFEIRVCGTVQGVGFRPTVWRLARDERLVGDVRNDGMGVLIRASGSSDAIDRFVVRLQRESPPLSRIEKIETRRLDKSIDFQDFQIVDSAAGENTTRVAPDAAICGACRDEILDPDERRFGYPFANCTHCGPRFSIVTAIPYDRVHTTMSEFVMCDKCRGEYGQPSDRRFHAQPIACPACGPSIWLEDLATATPENRSSSADVVRATARLLVNGAIVAIRGLGGFHLACDATSPATVERLRRRKRRYGKPLALMATDLDMIRDYCHISGPESELLRSSEAPIVLLSLRTAATLAKGIAPGLDTIGFMLPYNPLHLLIMRQIDRPLVMTSGNISDEPQITDVDQARLRLRGIADAALMHDREIANRIDDSVVRIIADRPRLIRRARGYAPAAIALPTKFADAPDLLAYGGELKSTFCLLKDGAAILSQHQGDLEDVATLEDYEKNLRLYAEMYDHQPTILVVDLHPEYLSTKLAEQRAENDRLPIHQVQHHHAHIASCMAEHGIALDAPKVLGIALDGLGLGDDGTIWGGEFLLADYRGYRRLGTFKPVAMLGGAQAIREPWRNTYAHLAAAFDWSELSDRFSSLPIFKLLASKPLATLDRMLEKGLNVPLASSCGRLFDAVAAAVGLCADQAIFEGQGAMELESIAGDATAATPYPFSICENADTGLLYLESRKMWDSLLADLALARPVAEIATSFHVGLATAIHAMISRIQSVNDAAAAANTIALSGGCFQNKLLLEVLRQRLAAGGYQCISHANVPANDGGLALGQAAIAAARAIDETGRSKKQPTTMTRIRNEACA